MNTNVPDQLKNAATAPLNTEQVTPEEVKAYMAEMAAREENRTTDAETKIEIKPEGDVMHEAPGDVLLTEALVDLKDVPVTLEEQTLFLKAVLNDAPVRLTESLFNGALKVDMRSRYAHEQQRIFDALRQDITDKIIEPTDTNLYVTRMQSYCAVLVVERINGQLFSNLVLDKTGTPAEDIKKLREAVDEKIKHLSSVRWTALLNAIRIFETKCAKLSSEAANETFWKPRI